MNEALDLVGLSDGRPGRRSLVCVEVREGAAGDGGAGGEKRAVLDFVASTAAVDRYDEVIVPAGWKLENYRRNPVFQNAHNYGDVLFTLGRALVTEIREVGGQPALFQSVEFAVDVNPVARIAHGLYKGGFLKAVSVGFIPVRWENGTQESGFRRKYLEQELVEVSAVAIPANPEALALGVKSGAVGKADLAEAVELLRSLAGFLPADVQGERLNLARELGRVMRRA